ncbi:putative NAD(P)H-dependent FMN reductase [Gordonia effusa NBRC 100432]|uniref:Putative NAD(P)H-dependent FMN reductase n=1 Tax=Gordonia effusa NBRC 100432 TaxID=1077974 RepID=H0R434_9ACTN|nr:CE1759 family FMN reductase [Gordonia effusa]GAB19835.1 putative NAD(P)H-dependent FMN reductase [Gordonia effusa NBRC 100432]
MTHESQRRLVVVNAGLSDPSSTRMLADRLAAEFVEGVAGQGLRVDTTVLDLRELAVEIANSTTSGFGVGDLRSALDAVHRADALIVATPVFNASYSGLFKSFFDLVEVEPMAGKPVLIAATGGSARHSMVLDYALRPLFAYLRAVVMPTGVYAASQDWSGNTGDTAMLSDRIGRAANELARSVGADAADGVLTPRSVVEPVASNNAEATGIDNFARLLGGAIGARR